MSYVASNLQRTAARANLSPQTHGLPLKEAYRAIRILNDDAGKLGPVLVDRPVALYGAGNLGKLAKAHLDHVGVPITLVVDANAAAYRQDSTWAGIPIAAPADVSDAVKRAILLTISIVTCPFVPLAAHLKGEGWARCVPFYDVAEGFRARHPLGNGWFADPLDAVALARCEAVIEGWADDISRAHHLSFAAWRMIREEWSFEGAPVEPTSRFFIDDVRSALTAHERVLDVGAHHGTYLAKFLAETNRAFDAAWAIEPDPANRSVLARWVAGLGEQTRRKITIIDKVVGARADTIQFHVGLGYASCISPTGECMRVITPIDELGLDPTVIKLHLEGYELEALRGARETIRRHRPIVMATTYHNSDGLAETPFWLMKSLDDYRIYFRMHNWCGTGAVVYAIPVERTLR